MAKQRYPWKQALLLKLPLLLLGVFVAASRLPVASAYLEDATAVAALEMDVAVTSYFVDASGKRLGTPSAKKYHVVRRRAGNRWSEVRTWPDIPTYDVINRDGGTSTLVRRQRITRLEDDGDGGPLRMYDENGRLLPPLPKSATRELEQNARRAKVPDLSQLLPWRPAERHSGSRSDGNLEGVLLFHARKTAREDELRRTLGPANGSIKGLRRFVRNRGNLTEEYLVDPNAAAVVEFNVIDNGHLATHTRVSWIEHPRGGFKYRRSQRTEGLSNYPAQGSRVVSETVYDNVQVSKMGGGQ